MHSHRPRTARVAVKPPKLDLRFVELFENANDVVIVNDGEGRIVAANRAAREFGGYTANDVARGVHLSEVLPPLDCEAALLLTQRALAGLSFPAMYEREVMLRDGTRRVVELRSNVIHRPGQPGLLQTIGRDVTEQRAAAAFRAALLQVSQALLTVQSVDEIGRVICEQASRVLDVDGAYLWLRRGAELIGAAAAGRGATEFIGQRCDLADSFVGTIYRENQVRVTNDVGQSPYGDDATLGPGVRALMAVPLRGSAGAVGVLVFANSINPQTFSAEQSQRALIFAAQASVAIESAVAREREEDEGRVSTALLRVARAIRESLEEAAVVPQIARSAREVLRCDWTVVALWDTAKGVFRATTTEGWPAHVSEEVELLELGPGTLGLVDRLLAHETVEMVEPQRRAELWERWHIGSLLSVPMVRAGRVIGALTVGYHARHGAFSVRERRIAEGIAAQAAVAVDNARLIEALRRANEMKSEFLGMMSHELRTPLSAILGYTELMQEGAMGPIGLEQRETLDRILLHGRALFELISNTLDVNRLEAGRITLEPSEFSLADLVDELRSEFGVSIADRERVTIVWPEVFSPVPYYTDRSKLKLILRNLIDNALKFTSAGSVTMTIEDLAESERVRLVVSDTGHGIPQEALPMIFEMFQQVEGRNRARGGVGLGLYLVRRYAQLLGGGVVADSRVGEGSRFTVEIPRRLPNAK